MNRQSLGHRHDIQVGNIADPCRLCFSHTLIDTAPTHNLHKKAVILQANLWQCVMMPCEH